MHITWEIILTLIGMGIFIVIVEQIKMNETIKSILRIVLIGGTIIYAVQATGLAQVINKIFSRG